MKKIVLALACAMMVAGAATAQVTYGVKVGFDMTHFWGKDLQHKMQPNYQAGVFMEAKLNNTVAIAPEVVFAAQGGKESITVTDAGLTFEATEKYNTNYINVPVMFKFYVSDDFSIDFGPQVGFNVYSKSTTKLKLNGKELPSGMNEKFTTNYKDATNTVDFGLGLGGTFNLSENAFVQARYTMGLTKVFKGVDGKNGNIQLAFGYRF